MSGNRHTKTKCQHQKKHTQQNLLKMPYMKSLSEEKKKMQEKKNWHNDTDVVILWSL